MSSIRPLHHWRMNERDPVTSQYPPFYGDRSYHSHDGHWAFSNHGEGWRISPMDGPITLTRQCRQAGILDMHFHRLGDAVRALEHVIEGAT